MDALNLEASRCVAIPTVSKAARALRTAPFLLSPVVFPWYLCPLVPLVAMKPSAALLAWVIAAPLTYEVVNSHSWEPAAWPLVILTERR